MTEYEIFQYLTSKGLTSAGAAGAIGNFIHESRLIFNNLQNSFESRLGTDESYTKAVDEGSYTRERFISDGSGYGLAQWTFSTRKAGLYDLAKKRKASIADPKVQLDYFMEELERYTSLKEVLTSTDSVKEASNTFLEVYERPWVICFGSAAQKEVVRQARYETSVEVYDRYVEGKSMYTNSPLVTYTNLLPLKNTYGARRKIDTISIHCVAGVNATLGALYSVLYNNGFSSHYGVDSWGGMGLLVEEKNASICTSNYDNDMRAITIETMNSAGAPDWPVSDAALKALINLCADICKRNGKTVMIWNPDRVSALAYVPKDNEMRMTVHRWFANKACPGNYLMSKMGYIADEVNKILGGAPAVQEEKPEETIYRVQTGAFSVYERAHRVLTALQGFGYEGIVVKDRDNGSFKVQLGAFRVQGNANNVLSSVRALAEHKDLEQDIRATVAKSFITTKGGDMVATYTKSVNDIALEVIQGKWGSGADRINRLTQAGYDAQAVQRRVNEIL